MRKLAKTEARGLAVEDLHSPSEIAAFYSMEALSTDRMLRLVRMSLLRRSHRELAPQQIIAQMTTQGEAAKPTIEARSGASISSPDAAKRLGVSDETVRNRVKASKLIGYAATEKKLRLPEWQFSTPNKTHPWVLSLLEALGVNGWPVLDFLTVPRNGPVADVVLHGETLLQKLQSGEVEFVLEAARRANPA